MRQSVSPPIPRRCGQAVDNRLGICRRAIVFVYLATMSLVNCAPLSRAAAEETIGLSQVTFVTSPKWYVINRTALDGDTLIFRKYSFSVIDGEIGGIEKTKNIFDYGCQRSSRYSDYLVFHFPSWARSGLDNKRWVPRLRLNVALNELRVTFEVEGEYKNNSIFVDLNDQQRQNLSELMAAGEIVIDYGLSGERLQIEQRMLTPDGEGDVAGFIEEFVTKVLSPSVDGGKVVSFDADSMLKACLLYKRSGRVP